MRWVKRILAGIGVLVLVLLVAAIGILLWFHIPSNAAGVVAQTVCSAKYVAGRDLPTEELVASDVTPQSPILGVVSTEVDEANKTVTRSSSASSRALGPAAPARLRPRRTRRPGRAAVRPRTARTPPLARRRRHGQP